MSAATCAFKSGGAICSTCIE
ncbi:MAG TPA: hypothetical protein DHW71_03155 [Gammaproteobacteria bacterium]|nr:hypothetical protein [Gammaproteobacteria bacterium]